MFVKRGKYRSAKFADFVFVLHAEKITTFEPKVWLKRPHGLRVVEEVFHEISHEHFCQKYFAVCLYLTSEGSGL